MRNTIKKVALVMTVCAAGLLAACNTVEGVGKDIKAGGKAIENAASDK
jgi:predicted small secreted protein